MKTSYLSRIGLFCLIMAAFFSCHQEDPGPREDGERSFSVIDFDRLEIDDAFDVTVQEGVAFTVTARGDYRNLNDIEIYKNGSTLRVRFNNSKSRQYTTYVTITMPIIRGVDFSGAVNGKVIGFTQPIARFDASLSGASVGQININADEVFVWLTGSSNAWLTGEGSKIQVNVSGASELTSFDYPVERVESVVSGASIMKVNAIQHLKAEVSGASEVVYRGDPEIEAEVSGASSLHKE